jgi:hypothetical protein
MTARPRLYRRLAELLRAGLEPAERRMLLHRFGEPPPEVAAGLGLAPPLARSMPDSRTYPVPLLLKRRCDRTAAAGHAARLRLARAAELLALGGKIEQSDLSLVDCTEAVWWC